MNKPTNVKFSSHLLLTAGLSGGITITLSIIYILLCIAGLIFRYDCDAGLSASTPGDEYFWKTIFSAYIQESTCDGSEMALTTIRNEITGEYTVFVLIAITLSSSFLCLVTAIVLITILQDTNGARHINLAVFAYIGSCIAALVIDLTTATHFGLDHTYLTSVLEDWTDSEAGFNELRHRTEVLRQGALLLMSIALKGYVAPAINIILLILLFVYVVEHRKMLKSDEHSIHKLGVLTAYDQPRKPTEDNNWSSQPEMFSPFARGPQLNNGFIDDEPPSPPRTPRREPTRSDLHYNNSFDRSDSWHHTQPNAGQNLRPFTYLEDIKRPVPTRPPPSPAVESPWRRDPWAQTPPVPVPDYSPQPARRLKSALKPAYM